MTQQRYKRRSKRQRAGNDMMLSALSKAPFLGTIADAMIKNSQFGPLLKALKAAGLDTQKLTRQLIAKGNNFQQDPITATIELILQEQDQLACVFKNLSEDPGKIKALATAISVLFSDRDGSLESHVIQVLQALAANPAMIQNLLRNKTQFRAMLSQLFGSRASPPSIVQPMVQPITSTLATTNGHPQLPVLPMAGQGKRPPVSNSLAESNNYGYLHMPADQQMSCARNKCCCQSSCRCCQCSCL